MPVNRRGDSLLSNQRKTRKKKTRKSSAGAVGCSKVKSVTSKRDVDAGGTSPRWESPEFSPRVGPRGPDSPRPHAELVPGRQRREEARRAGAAVRTGRQSVPGPTHHLDESLVSFCLFWWDVWINYANININEFILRINHTPKRDRNKWPLWFLRPF